MNAAMTAALFFVGIWLGGLGMWWRVAGRNDELDQWEKDLLGRQRELQRLHNVVASEQHRQIIANRHPSEPCDWDGESYCTNRCGRPAAHRRLSAMVGEHPVYEMVCCACASHRSQQKGKQ